LVRNKSPKTPEPFLAKELREVFLEAASAEPALGSKRGPSASGRVGAEKVDAPSRRRVDTSVAKTSAAAAESFFALSPL